MSQPGKSLRIRLKTPDDVDASMPTGSGTALSDLEQLRKSNPSPLEPPRRSLRVAAVMWLTNRTGNRLTWPDYHKADRELVQSEYDADNSNFWDAFRGVVEPRDFAGKDVLDVGCGWGGRMIALAERVGIRHLAGFDIPPRFEPTIVQDFADSRGVDSEWKQGFGEAIPFPDERFDIALLDDVLEHVKDPRLVLTECARVLRPGGLVVVRFPSIKMMGAHHFDRATGIPAVHYLASMKTWCAGLNHYLLAHRDTVDYVPFSEVVPSFTGREMPHGFSGLTWSDTRKLVHQSPFRVRQLELVGAPVSVRERVNPAVLSLYELLRRLPPLREFLSRAIAFVGEKKQG
jgi:ubiquinone/menaquinone biosynthesis C-methylase UbiE